MKKLTYVGTFLLLIASVFVRSSFVQATYVNYVTPTIQHAGKYTYISRGDITQYNFDRNATFNTNSNSGDNITDKMILNNSTICVFANLGGSYTNVHTTLGVTYFDNPYTIKINGEAISMYPVATHDSVNDITCGKVGTLKSHTIDLTITNKQNGYTTPPSAPYRMNDTYAYPVIEKIIDSKSGSITGSIESNKEFCVSFGFYDYDIQGTIKNNLIYDTFSGDTYSVQLNGKDVPISSFGNNRICANTGTLSGKKANITISNGINTSAAWPILTSAPIESTPVITQPIITPTIAPSKLSMTLTGFNPKLTGADAYTKGTALQDTYLVIFGTFNSGTPTVSLAPTTTVTIDGKPVDLLYSDSKQINISLSGIPVGTHIPVAVTSLGTTETAYFDIVKTQTAPIVAHTNTLSVTPKNIGSRANTLSIGSTGADVKALQQNLKDQGLYTGKVDGKLGKKTAAAIRAFQTQQGLTASGLVDASTRAALNLNPKSQTDGSPSVPGYPTVIMAAPGNAQASVAFTTPTTDGGSPITGYTVFSSPAGGVDTNAGTTALTHLITGLTNGTAYTFYVTATNASGMSLASSPSDSVTPSSGTQNSDYRSFSTWSLTGGASLSSDKTVLSLVPGKDTQAISPRISLGDNGADFSVTLTSHNDINDANLKDAHKIHFTAYYGYDKDGKVIPNSDVFINNPNVDQYGTITSDKISVPAGVTSIQNLYLTSEGVGVQKTYVKDFKITLYPHSVPVILDHVSPTSGPIGTKVTITGSGFTSSTIAQLILGDLNSFGYDGSTVSSDGKTLTFTIPQNVGGFSTGIGQTTPPGMYTVRVLDKNTDKPISDKVLYFTVAQSSNPSDPGTFYISDLVGSDITGKSAHWSVQQGGLLTITGKFLNNNGNTVSIGSTNISPSSQNAAQIQVLIPSDMQTGSQVVTVKNGTLVSNAPTVTVISKAAILPSLAISGIQGYSADGSYTPSNLVPAGETLVLYGNFAGSGNTVTIDGFVTSTSYQSASQINALAPLTPGMHSVTVKNGAVTSTSMSFTIIQKPITSNAGDPGSFYISDLTGSNQMTPGVAPTHWSVQQGGLLTITGKFLDNNANTVDIGGTSVSVNNQNATQLSVTIPSNMTTGAKIVTVKNGTLTSNGPTLSIIAISVTPPSISILGIQGFSNNGYAPSSAILAGQSLILYGNFPASGNTVLIDGISTPTTYQSASQINSQAPVTLGTHAVVVKNGDTASSAPASFTVVSATTATPPATTGGAGATDSNAGATPPATIPPAVTASDIYSWVAGVWSDCVSGRQTMVASCKGSLSGTTSATSDSGVGRCGFPYTGITSRSCQ